MVFGGGIKDDRDPCGSVGGHISVSLVVVFGAGGGSGCSVVVCDGTVDVEGGRVEGGDIVLMVLTNASVAFEVLRMLTIVVCPRSITVDVS